MPQPDFIANVLALDFPFPADKVETSALQTAEGRAILFTIKDDLELPPHSHGAQWGTGLSRASELTIEGATQRFRPGESCAVPADTVHAVKVQAGMLILDVFEEKDRYALKA
ncbi:MAG: cupin domain-containing protein [Pseudomonadota bacterium]